MKDEKCDVYTEKKFYDVITKKYTSIENKVTEVSNTQTDANTTIPDRNKVSRGIFKNISK